MTALLPVAVLAVLLRIVHVLLLVKMQRRWAKAALAKVYTGVYVLQLDALALHTCLFVRKSERNMASSQATISLLPGAVHAALSFRRQIN